MGSGARFSLSQRCRRNLWGKPQNISEWSDGVGRVISRYFSARNSCEKKNFYATWFTFLILSGWPCIVHLNISLLLGVTDRLPNQRRARDVITPERKEIQLSLWVLMWKMRAGLERDNRESCFCTKRATFACTIGQSLQQLGFYSTWFPRDKGGFS